MSLHSVAPTALPFAVAFLARLARRPVLVVTADAHTQEALLADLTSFRPGVLEFPAWETMPHEDILPEEQTIADRLRTLERLTAAPESTGGDADFVVAAPVPALLQRTFSPAAFRREQFRFSVGDPLEREALVQRLTQLGYHPEVQVGEPGEFAVRGGIVDFYPLNASRPVRVEFAGNQVESIRAFDPVTQRTQALLSAVEFATAGELGFLRQCPAEAGCLADYLPPATLLVLAEPDAVLLAAAAYQNRLPDQDPFHVSWSSWLGRGLTLVHLTDQPAVEEDDDHWEWGLSSLEAFRPLDVPASTPAVAEQSRRSFFDQIAGWLTDGWSVHLLAETDAERRRVASLWTEYTATLPAPRPALPAHLLGLSRGLLWPAARLAMITAAEVFGRYRQRQLRRPGYATAPVTDWREFDEGDFVVHLQHGVGRYRGFRVIETAGQRQEVLAVEYAGDARLYVPLDQAHLLSKYVGLGRRIPELHELGGAKWDRQKLGAERAIRDLAADLLALQAARATLPGHACGPDTPWQRDFESTFPYEETPDQLAAIAAVKADLETPRPMDRLICGDVGFGKTEVAIRAAFKAVLEGLQVAVLCPTTVLAEQHWNTFRDRMTGFPVVVEMLSRFRTPRDQKRIAKLVRSGVVDIVIGTHRLLSADVQFKKLGLVVIDEEQRFGVRHKEQFKRLRQLVDVVTLSATPIPRTLYMALTGARDLSTIQTPPSQRLPVETHIVPFDERLIRTVVRRELARGGQVFYLHNRVQTIEGVADRLRRLLEDGESPGQDRGAARLGEGLPTSPTRPPDWSSAPGGESFGAPSGRGQETRAQPRERRAGAPARDAPPGDQSATGSRQPRIRIAIGHGQMSERQLEEVMHQFVQGRIDVLVCTTIIESGLDIPNANTILIDRADRFGLADLYQLRGRVGRHHRQAYCYILLPRHVQLVAAARKRISAIKQYSSLGSGYKIAMRDLEIRGAGNLLGTEQSGHITAIGFELYCQLLKESISRLKGEEVKRPPQVVLKLDFLLPGPSIDPDEPESFIRPATQPAVAETLARIPTDYIGDTRLRVEAYRRIAQVAEPAEVTALRAELQDRFGALPRMTRLLLSCAELKLAAAAAGFDTVETRGDKIMLSGRGQFFQTGGRFPRLSRPQPEGKLTEIRQLLGTLGKSRR